MQLPIIDLELGKASIQADSDADALVMIAKLIELLPEDLVSLSAAYRARDRKQLLATLHKIKGGLFYCGVPRLHQQIDTVYEWVKSTDDVSSFSERFKLIEQEFQALKDTYQSLST